VIFGLGPVWLFLDHRWRMASNTSTPQQRRSVHLTNLVIAALVAAGSAAIGFGDVLRLYVPVFFVASVAGIWLFYVQHQFEGTYWEDHENWDYTAASLAGSSYYRLPRVLEWLTGRIGLHHIHHLDPKIPNYQLRRCHDETTAFHAVPVLTVRSSLRSLRLKLWDTGQRRLVGFAEARRTARARRAARGPLEPAS
jgi:omega-6 fatty acid desaturase (delta-12 desaturase)